MNLKCILLSKRREFEKATYCTIPFIQHSGKGKTNSKNVSDCPGLGEKRGLNNVWDF